MSQSQSELTTGLIAPVFKSYLTCPHLSIHALIRSRYPMSWAGPHLGTAYSLWHQYYFSGVQGGAGPVLVLEILCHKGIEKNVPKSVIQLDKWMPRYMLM